MSPGVSIVICCHNSAAKLPETLRHLAVQQVAPQVRWEVVLVDNASTDDTANVAQKLWTYPDVPLRVVAEPQPGLSHARICGVRVAQYEVISFIDDDNWVCANWLNLVTEIFTQDSAIGVAGGPSEAVFDSPRPPWFDGIKGFYAAGTQHQATGDVTDSPGTMLWGAGMNIRKSAIEALLGCGFQFLLSDRKGASLSTGGDTETCFALRAVGWRFWYDERLVLKHFMPANRLAWSYARKLMRGMGEAAVIFNIYLIALGRHPFNTRTSFKHTWLFQFLKAAKNLCKLMLTHPVDCLVQPEGHRSVLDFETIMGHLTALLAISGQYKNLIRQIRSAQWNRKCVMDVTAEQ